MLLAQNKTPATRGDLNLDLPPCVIARTGTAAGERTKPTCVSVKQVHW